MRGALLAVAVVAGTVLGTAMQLTPDPRGYGTHEQLGMAPCWMIERFGWPCPSCGMTTSWAYAVRGDLRSAVAVNLGGAVSALVTACVGAWGLTTAVAGRWIVGHPTFRGVLWGGTWIALATLLDWIRRL